MDTSPTHILIVYGTSEGQTRKVAEFLAERFRRQSCAVTLLDVATAGANTAVENFDAAVLAGRVHAGRYPRRLVGFARRHANTLSAMPSAFVSVSMNAARHDDRSRAAVAGYVARFIAKTGWTPRLVEQVAGARRYSQHNVVGSWILRAIDRQAGFPADTSRDHEWTDWQALSALADGFLKTVPRGVASDAGRLVRTSLL